MRYVDELSEAFRNQLALAYKEAVSIVFLLLVLFFRPTGLFGRRDTGELRAF